MLIPSGDISDSRSSYTVQLLAGFCQQAGMVLSARMQECHIQSVEGATSSRVSFCEVLVFTIVCVLTFATVIFPHLSDYLSPGDDGYYLHIAQRILGGEVLDVDVASRHSGLIHFLNASALFFWGSDLLATRVPLAISTAITASLGYLLLRGAGVIVVAAGALVLLIFNAFMAPTPNAHWYCIPLVLLIALVLEREVNVARRQVLAGLLVGLILGLRQLTGAAMAIAVFSWEITRSASRNGERRCPVTFAQVLLCACLAIVVFQVRQQYSQLFDFIFVSLWPLIALLHYILIVSVPWKAALRCCLRLAGGVVLGLVPLLVFHLYHSSLPLWLEDTVVRAGGMTALPYLRDSSYSIYLAAGVAYLAKAETFSDMQNALFWVVLPMVPFVAGIRYLLYLVQRQRVPVLLHLSLFYSLIAEIYRIHLFLYYVAAISLLALFCSERNRALRFSFAVLSIWLSVIAAYFHLGQGIHREIWRGAKLQLAKGDLPHMGVAGDPEYLVHYKRIREAIKENSRADTGLLVLPYAPEIYVISERKNMFRFVCGPTGIQTAGDVEMVKSRLETIPELIFIYEPASKFNTEIQSELADWIKGRSEEVAQVDGTYLYRYSSPKPKPSPA